MWLKKLKDWLSSFRTCSKGKAREIQIPSEIGQEERIMRTVFSDANVKKNGQLKSNFMRPQTAKPDEEDPEIASNKLSTTRYDYAGIEFCRRHAKAHQSEPNRHYWGFGRFVVEHLIAPWTRNGKNFVCAVEYRPVDDNPAHANINLGYRLSPGATLDSETQEYIKHLAESAEVMKDPNPSATTWTGDPAGEAMYGTLEYQPKE